MKHPKEYIQAVASKFVDAKTRLPQVRDVPSLIEPFLTPVRVGYLLLGTVFIWFLASYIPSSQDDMLKYRCFGPGVSPFEMDPNTYSEWHRESPSPVKFSLNEEVVNSSDIHRIDLNKIQSTADAIKNKERVLILSPLRDAATYIPKYFELLSVLSYPHDLIDLGFLISDTTDETLSVLAVELERIQNGPNSFRHVNIFSKDFGFSLDNLDVEERHAYSAQAPRRKAMARARNYLLASALRPEHSWVMWRDVDIVDSPKTIIEDLIKHDTDIIVPNIWFHRMRDGKDIEGRFDYNSWVDTPKAVALANSLPKDTIIVEGYKEFDTGREYMCRLGNWRWDNHEELELDGIGGVNIVVKADVHRTGVNFPAYAFENQCETEGFAKMAKRAGYRVVGLPNYVVWHIDTDEKKAKN